MGDEAPHAVRRGLTGTCLAAILPTYRRACGNLRLWSGRDNQESNARVRRSRQEPPVRCAVFGPKIPWLRATGSGQFYHRRRWLDEV